MIAIEPSPINNLISIGEGFKYEMITDIDKLIKYKDRWNDLSNHIYSSWEYNFHCISSTKNIEKPYTLIIKKGSEIIAIIAGYIINSRFPLVKIGYFPLLKLKVRKIIVPIGCTIGDFSELDSTILREIINNSLNKLNVNMITFRYLNFNSVFYQKYNKTKNVENTNTIKHYKVDLLNEKELFLKKLKKYKQRSKTPDKFNFQSIEIRCYKEKNSINDFVHIAEKISKKSFKSNIGHSFTFSQEKVNLYHRAAVSGNLFCYTLFIENQPCAFLVIIYDKGKCYFDQSGYNYLFRYCSPGSYLLINALYEIIELKSVTQIDFGPEEISFKQRLSPNYEEVTHFVIYTNSIKANIIKIIVYLTSFFKKFQNFGIQEKLKNTYKKLTLAKLKRQDVKNL